MTEFQMSKVKVALPSSELPEGLSMQKSNTSWCGSIAFGPRELVILVGNILL